MLKIILTVLLMIACVIATVAICLQTPEETGFQALGFRSGTNRRRKNRKDTFLFRVTAIGAAVFLLVCIVMNIGALGLA